MNLDHATTLDDVAVLAEPVRRRLYAHVVAQPEPVGRDAAAAALGIGRSLSGRLLMYDALAGSFDEMAIAKRPDCPTCSSSFGGAR